MGNSCCKCPCEYREDESITDNKSNDTNLSENYIEYKFSKPADTDYTEFPYPTRLRAICSYHGDGLNFNKGDPILVDEVTSDPYVYGVHAFTKQKGYIRRDLVCFDDGTPRSTDAWFPIDRLNAEMRLISEDLADGTYIIRKREGSNKKYALSVLHRNNETNEKSVKHYIIYVKEDNQGYYLEEGKEFETMSDLINYYSRAKGSLCCILTNPCPKSDNLEISFHQLELERSSITLERQIGKGEFGLVYKGLLDHTISIAIKRLQDQSHRHEFIEEAKTMHKLRHARILQIIGVCTEPVDEPILIITEFMAQGSLRDVLINHAPSPWEISFTVMLLCQISDGMKYLESKDYVHRDLRTANILVNDNFDVKVADFGLARFLSGSRQLIAKTKFPIRWTAPEAATECLYSTKSDVWSFGVVMYEILTYGKTPYEDYSSADLETLIERLINGYRLPNPLPDDRKDGPEFYRTMLSCWQIDPDSRPTFKSLYKKFSNWDTPQIKIPTNKTKS